MTESPFKRVESPAQQRQNELAEEHLRQLRRDLREVLALPAGRRVLWYVLEGICGVFASTERGSDRATALRNGARAAGLLLQRQLQDWAPAEFVLLLTENFTRTLEQLQASRPE
jgi:hypothetical protein